MIIAQQFIAGFQIGQRIDSPVGTAEDAASDGPSSLVPPFSCVPCISWFFCRKRSRGVRCPRPDPTGCPGGLLPPGLPQIRTCPH